MEENPHPDIIGHRARFFEFLENAMRVFLYRSTELPPAHHSQIRQWALGFGEELRKNGLEADLFCPSAHRISKKDIVHVFGFELPENWYWLRQLSRGVLLSPTPFLSETFPKPRARREAAFFAALSGMVDFEESSAFLPEKKNPFSNLLSLSPERSAQRMIPFYASLR